MANFFIFIRFLGGRFYMNIISSINQQPNIRINTNPKINSRVRYNYGHTNVSFGSSRSEGIIRLLDDELGELLNGSEFNIANKIKFKKVMQKALPSIMTPENFINKGRESKVYRINDNYVAKIKRGFYAKDAIKPLDVVTLPNQKFKDIDFYYGEPVAKIGKVSILRNATPTKDNVYCGAIYESGRVVSEQDERHYKEVYLPMCASLPQESFDNFAENLQKLNGISTFGLRGREYYTPDVINPNNIIISDGKFKLVDQLDKTHCKDPNSLYTMFEPLLVRVTPDFNAEYDKDLVHMRGTIYNKCIRAAKKVGLPPSSPLKYEYSDFTIANILRMRD